MISVTEAEQLIQEATEVWPPCEKPLVECYGKVLREDLVADRDFPPYDRVMMDGIAIKWQAWYNGVRKFICCGSHHAGKEAPLLEQPNQCWEVTTGSVLPRGSDCVIPVEELDWQGKWACLAENLSLQKGQFIHRKGSDYPQNSLLVSHGQRLDMPKISVAASVGKAKLSIASDPKIAIVATGDELVAIDTCPTPHQIRCSNSYAMQAGLRQRGYCQTELFHLPDDEQKMKQALEKILQQFQVVILSGGVSKGKYDFLPKILEQLGVEKIFHRVRQKPGKPLWFGRSSLGKPVFGIPGNPVTAMVCLRRHVLPFLQGCAGEKARSPLSVTLKRNYHFAPALTCFLPVKLQWQQGQAWAEPVFTNNSGDFASVATSDGFLELSEERDHFPAGWVAPFYPW